MDPGVIGAPVRILYLLSGKKMQDLLSPLCKDHCFSGYGILFRDPIFVLFQKV